MGYPSAEYLRAYRARKRAEWDALPKIPCACGCGTMIPPVNRDWKPAKFFKGHHLITTRGVKHPPELIERLRESGRRAAHRGADHYMFGKKHSDETKTKISDAKSGEKNPGWRGGTGTLPYGPTFTRKFKRMIRERDGNACRRCGKTREQQGRTLEVHHLDHDKMNNDPSNLVTACSSCNVWAWWHQDEPFLPTHQALPTAGSRLLSVESSPPNSPAPASQA